MPAIAVVIFAGMARSYPANGLTKVFLPGIADVDSLGLRQPVVIKGGFIICLAEKN